MLPGKPQRLRLINEALIREALASRGEATTADLVEDTGLSQTTVGQILDQMRRGNIICETDKRASSGGRRAAAWVLNPKAWSSIALSIERDSLAWGIANALGTLTGQGTRIVKNDPLAEALELASELKAEADREDCGRSALAVGVPAAVQGGKVLTGEFLKPWADFDIEELFAAETGLPVVVENDLNATAVGYLRVAEASGYKIHSLVYIHFNGGDCIGSGLVLEGKVFRGAANYSGELGYLPMGDGRILDDLMLAADSDERFVDAIVSALRIVNCVVNPALLVVGGRGFRFDLGDDIDRAFKALVEERVRPSLVFVPDSRPYYTAGLAGLAAERIFPLVKITASD
jgi:predicted NBD/HSP70 family sugar kinase